MTSAFTNSLPHELVTHITVMCGKKGEQWFEELPKMICELEKRWTVSVQAPFPGIEFNFVAPAVSENGERVVVKISPPFERIEIFGEAKYLRTREGHGAVKLLAEDAELRAILIEHALPGEALFQRFSENLLKCVQPAINILHSILRPPPDDMTNVATLDQWFNNFLRYRETDFPRRFADNAVDIYQRLSNEPERTFYLHGDFHPGNVVSSDRAPFLAIDPKGIVGHVAYDIAVFLNNLHWWQKDNPNVQEILDIAITQFSDAFEIKAAELRQWAFFHMVISAWWNFEDAPELYEGGGMTDIWRV